MGLFTPKKQTFVTSVVYNLAGDINERPDFLKTTVIGAVMGKQKKGVGETLNDSYLNGPGIKLRSFGRWARYSGYSHTVGQQTSKIWVGNNLNQDTLAAVLAGYIGDSVQIQTAEIGVADYNYWTQQWMVTHHPDLVFGSWTSDFDEGLNQIIVHSVYGDEVFTPANFDIGKMYLYAVYSVAIHEEYGPVEVGPVVTLPTGDPFPSTSDYTNVSSTTTPSSLTLNETVRTVITYSDSTPGSDTSVITPTSASYAQVAQVWMKTEYLGDDPDPDVDRTQTLKTVLYLNQNASKTSVVGAPVVTTEVIGGVTKTTTKTTTTESLLLVRTTRTDTQIIYNDGWNAPQVLIYQQGSGEPSLEAMFGVPYSDATFVPFIPIRLDNGFIDDGRFNDLWEGAKKAIPRALGNNTNFKKIKNAVADNPKLSDIDYCYMVFGVSLNTKENACRRYLYKFFQEIMEGQDMSGSEYASWKVQWALANLSWNRWIAWKEAQDNPSSPLFGTPEPDRAVWPEPPQYSIDLNSNGHPYVNYNMRIEWYGISELVRSGVIGQVGEVLVEQLNGDDFTIINYGNGGLFPSTASINGIRFRWQATRNTYRQMDIRGLQHTNTIYGGKSVVITGDEAFNDSDESGFIIPLHEQIFRSTALVSATQMSTACCYLVFNCYKVVKEKWYQSGFFKVLIVIAAIVIAIVSYGSGVGASIGLLGSAASVGATLGFTGTMAAIVGAIANAIAAMIVVQIVTAASTAIFGKQIGAIVGTLASIALISAGTAYANGMTVSISAVFGDLMRPENLLKLTEAGIGAYSSYVQASTQKIITETGQVVTQAETQMDEINKQIQQLYGIGTGGVINPLDLTEIGQVSVAEMPGTFLARTLMTGSDIGAMSLEMISDFAAITLSQELQP